MRVAITGNKTLLHAIGVFHFLFISRWQYTTYGYMRAYLIKKLKKQNKAKKNRKPTVLATLEATIIITLLAVRCFAYGLSTVLL